MILSSHLLRDVEECCDEVLVLKEGEIAVYCDLEEERRANRKFLELETHGRQRRRSPRRSRRWAARTRCSAAQQLKMVLPEGVEVRDLYRLAADARGADPPPGLQAATRCRTSSCNAMEVRPWRSMSARYRRYAGPLTPERWSRFLVFPRYAFDEVFQSQAVRRASSRCASLCPWRSPHPDLPAPQPGRSSALLDLTRRRCPRSSRIDATFFYNWLMIAAGRARVPARRSSSGPRSYSPDLRNNGLALYLSRPFSRAEYMLGKMSSC